MALSEEDRKKINQILREEGRATSDEKPPFPYGRHLYWTLMTSGLWLPIWIYKSFMHDYKWRQAQQKKRDNP